MEQRSLLFESIKSENRAMKALILKLKAKLETRNKEILALMKHEIIDLTNDEDYMLPEVKRKSLDEFIAWAFDEHDDEEKDEEIIYASPPTKKIKF